MDKLLNDVIVFCVSRFLDLNCRKKKKKLYEKIRITIIDLHVKMTFICILYERNLVKSCLTTSLYNVESL